MVLFLSLTSVSAIDSNDTATYLDNSQNNEIYIDDLNNGINEVDSQISASTDDVLSSNEDDSILGDITPELVIEDKSNTKSVNNITKGTKVSIDVNAKANFNWHYDSKIVYVYVGDSQYTTLTLSYVDSENRAGSFDYTFEEDGTYQLKVVMPPYNSGGQPYAEATSNIITYVVGNGGSSTPGKTNESDPVESATATISIYDKNYPSNSSIFTNGKYFADLYYNLVKSGSGFSDEIIEVYINNYRVGSLNPNSQSRLGNISIDENSTYELYVIFKATVNGKDIEAKSNVLSYYKDEQEPVITEKDVKLSINDATLPDNVVINVESNVDGIYVVTIGDEKVNVNVAGGKGSNTIALPAGNYSANLTYDDPVKGTQYLIKTFNVYAQTNSVAVNIRDNKYPNNSTIVLNGEYPALIEYYVALPEGSLIASDIIILCNGNPITTISNPADKTYTGIGGTVLLNESGEYVFTVQYKGYVFMGSSYDVKGNSITYKITISNETKIEDNTLSVVIDEVSYPNNSVATVKSNVDGDYVLTVGKNNYDVKVNGGIGTVSFNLPAGDYTAEVSSKINQTFKNSTKFKVNKSVTAISSIPSVDGNKTVIQVSLPKDASGKVFVTVGGKRYEGAIDNGVAKINLEAMNGGDYSYQVTYDGDNNYNKASTGGSFSVKTSSGNTNITPTKKNVSIKVSDVKVTVGGNAEIIATLIDEDGKAVSGGVISFSLDKTNNVLTDENGIASTSFKISKIGTYNVKVEFAGNDQYNPLSASAKITAVSSIKASDMTRGYNSGLDYQATFYDSNGNLLKNTEVTFIINGNDYNVKTNDNGVAKLNKKFSVAAYKVTVVNPATGEEIVKNLKIQKRITNNKNLVKDYLDAGKSFSVLIIGDDGKAAKAGQTVVMKVCGKTYKVKTNSKGYATLPINLLPKSYTITVEYKGEKVSNKITVKPVVYAKNAAVKKAKSVKYSATLKYSNGKPITGKKITFKIAGKKYVGTTNKKGIVNVNFKNLKVGKYKLSILYVKHYLSRTLTVKK